MRVYYFEYLYILWLIPLIILFFIFTHKAKMKKLNHFVSEKLRNHLLEGVSFRRQKFKMFLLLIIFALLLLSLLRPQWGFKWQEVKRKGVDIFIAVDISKSMLATDIQPTRLERAKRKITDLLNIAEGDRIGLIAFAGGAFVQTPLTLDYGSVTMFLNELDPTMITTPGTSFANLFDLVSKSYDESNKDSRVLLLITDGEDHSQQAKELAKEINKKGIKIFAIGIGQDSGSPIPTLDGSGFQKDSAGNLIMTKLEEGLLREIALSTGGAYVRSVSGDIDLTKIYGEIKRSVLDVELKSGKEKKYDERFQWPLLLALLLLILESLLPDRKRIKNVLLFPLLLLFSFNGHAFLLKSPTHEGDQAYKNGMFEDALTNYSDLKLKRPNDERLLFNQADALYKLKRYDQAEKSFNTLTKSKSQELSQKSFYNLGNTQYQLGKLEDAIASYESALKLNSKDENAKHNLEFVKKELQKKKEEEKNSKKNEEQNKDQQSRDQKDSDKKEGDKEDKSAQKEKDEKGDKDKKGEESNQSKDDPSKQSGEQKKEGDDKEQGAANKPSDKGPKAPLLSKEELEQWMSALEEKKNLKKKESGKGQYNVDKDW